MDLSSQICHELTDIKEQSCSSPSGHALTENQNIPGDVQSSSSSSTDTKSTQTTATFEVTEKMSRGFASYLRREEKSKKPSAGTTSRKKVSEKKKERTLAYFLQRESEAGEGSKKVPAKTAIKSTQTFPKKKLSEKKKERTTNYFSAKRAAENGKENGANDGEAADIDNPASDQYEDADWW